MKGNPISTFPPFYSFHIGEVIQIWPLKNISHKKEITNKCENLKNAKVAYESYVTIWIQEKSLETM